MKKALAFLTIVILSLIQLYIVEIFNIGNTTDMVNWLMTSARIVTMNLILLLCTNYILIMITGRIYFSGILSMLIFPLLSLMSLNKKGILGEPLFPWDLTLHKYAIDLLPNIYQKFDYTAFIIYFSVIALLILLHLFGKNYHIRVWDRVLAGIPALVLIGVMSVNPLMTNDIMPKIGIKNIDWDQKANYNKNGFTLAFMMNMKNIMISKPQDYNREAMEKQVEAIQAAFTTDSQGAEMNGPNVIFVMSEAFWDPTLLKGVSFSADPMPTMRSLMRKNIQGSLVSPTYGGGTSNVEFEVLTGNNMGFFPAGANPYQQYIKTPLPSLASIFREKGYNSIAIHSYYKWFFNRDKVYDLFGFNDFIGLADFVDPRYKGPFIEDEEVSQMIISEYEKSSEPVFIYAITMQNHGPYDTKRYENTEIEVEGRDLSDESKTILEQYTQGILDADRSLEQLIDYFYNEEEPTIIVFFGDHLPLLGNDFSVYYETGFVQSPNEKWTNKEYLALHSTPLLIWSNYPTPKMNLNEISASYLGAIVMDYINMPKPLYYQFLADTYHKLPVNLKQLKINGDGVLMDENSKKESTKEINAPYWSFQYDMMFGQDYTTELLMK